MNLQPANIAELSSLLSCANTRGDKISSVDLKNLSAVLEHKAEDMTATVEAGITLEAFQRELGKRRQCLPLDPPFPEKLTIADLLSKNVSGPRRFGYGTIGDYLIGIKVVLADGRIISPGGKVVKNVAGYDLAKLFIGGHDSLGIIAEATFKLRPLPEMEKFVWKKCKSLQEADALIEAVLNSELTPIVLDLHNTALVLGFAGTREEVEWQTSKAAELGIVETASLNYEADFWKESAPVHRVSVLPSKLIETLKTLGTASFIARAGNGTIYYRGANAPRKEALPVELMQRLKNEFDPKNILPEMPS